MNKREMKRVEDENVRNRLLKISRRWDRTACFAFLLVWLLLPNTKNDTPPLLEILINNPKEGLPYAIMLVTLDILLYIWLSVTTNKKYK